MSFKTRLFNKIPANVKHDFFKNTFFLSTIIKWNKLDWKIKNSESIEKEFYHSLGLFLIAYLIAITLKG